MHNYNGTTDVIYKNYYVYIMQSLKYFYYVKFSAELSNNFVDLCKDKVVVLCPIEWHDKDPRDQCHSLIDDADFEIFLSH